MFILLIRHVAMLAELSGLFFFSSFSKRIAKVVGNDLTLPMSAKCGFFTASLGLFFDELLCTRVIKTHLTFSLFISLFLFIFRLLLLWVLAAAFITATVDVSIYVIYSSLGRMGKKRLYTQCGCRRRRLYSLSNANHRDTL